jgi:hypothetical protein
VGVRTVQRWEHDAGFPVRRINFSVFALPQEVDEWLHRVPFGPRISKAHSTAERKALEKISLSVGFSNDLRKSNANSVGH